MRVSKCKNNIEFIFFANNFIVLVYRNIFFEAANYMALSINSVDNIEVSHNIIKMLNEGVTPFVCTKGSVGACGDLAPMAQIALVLLGEGKAFYKGELLNGKDAMSKANIKIPGLEARDGLAVINGSNFLTGMSAIFIYDVENWIKQCSRNNRREDRQEGRTHIRRRNDRDSSTPERNMERFRVEVGHRDRVKPGNLVGAIANETGLKGRMIGRILIFNQA